jgi:hypothetical protein
MPGAADGEEHAYPLCRGGGQNQQLTKFRFVNAELSCKTCMTYAKRREAAKQTEGETMAETETDHAATIEQITANIERAVSLAEAENVEGLAELNKETEALISGLPSRGKTPDGDFTWAGYKKAARDDMRKASQAQPKAEVAKPAAPAAPAHKEYTEYEGVSELVTMGAERVAEGVRLHIKASVTAKEIASIILDMWRRIEDKDGNPDITGKSDAAKKASSALYQAAGKALQGEDGFDVEKSVKSLMRSVQTQRTDVRADYLRGLDGDSEDAAAEREHFAKLLESKPEGVPASEFIAGHYGVGLKGEIEKARERQRAISAAARGEDVEADEELIEAADHAPETEIRTAVKAIRRGIAKAKPEDLEGLSDQAKAEIRDQLLELQDAIKAMITATI